MHVPTVYFSAPNSLCPLVARVPIVRPLSISQTHVKEIVSGLYSSFFAKSIQVREHLLREYSRVISLTDTCCHRTTLRLT